MRFDLEHTIALLSTWATHDLNHLHQIARVMADQIRTSKSSIGPVSRI